MAQNTPPQKAQLDKEEREHLESVVTEMRERVEANVEFQLTQNDLDEEPDNTDSLDENTQQLVSAIELEAVDGESWSEAVEQYVTGVGYTIVNRLSALRCMEVRDFINEEVTVFKDSGLTPAAETLVREEFLLEDEAILEAYHRACDDLAEEIEILFDRSTAYSQVDPDDDTFEELCEMLDSVPDEVWQADDVLGWVYEYYNVKLLDDLRRKGDRKGLEPEDVPPANQFYTPHWVVRMLTDNSLGKLYLEDTGELSAAVETQDSLTPDERKNRPLSPDESPDIADFCTYLVPSEEEGEPPDFDGPRDIRVIDPACGSGHFLLYAFDVLERIYRAETDLDHAEIPQEILRNNLYGVDLDMRACQLAAFNLYLKGRTRAEAEGASGFDMPEVGIVCSDATVADMEGVEAVFEEVAGDDPKVEDALRRILDAFEEVHGLGSLLDVRGTLGDLFEDEGVQITLDDDPREDHTLGQILHSLREAVDKHQSDSFLAQDLRSFVRLLDVLAQDYDVALMNPPYGAQNRMPRSVKSYVRDHYSYPPEYYINFFEVCDRLTVTGGRIGMLVPRSFMYKRTFEAFRADFLGDSGAFDYLAEFGIGVLDNATVRTVGTVIRSETQVADDTGRFYRLYDLEAERKESAFVRSLAEDNQDDDLQRRFEVPLSELAAVPGSPICYATPPEVRALHKSKLKLDARRADADGESIADAVQGLATGNNNRFVRKHWEIRDFERYPPLAKGGADAWILPQVPETVDFVNDGERLQRVSGSRFQNTDYYGREGLTWTYIKDTGRRFGYYPADGVFSHTGFMIFPKQDEQSLWNLLGALNSDLYHALFLSITTERHWNVGEVGRVPWHKSIAEIDKIEEYVRKQYRTLLSGQTQEVVSPYYVGTGLVPEVSLSAPFYDHPHRAKADQDFDIKVRRPNPATPIIEATRLVETAQRERERRLERLAEKIDRVLFGQFDISEEAQNDIRTEIFLRTVEDPEDREVPDPESVPEVPENLDEQVKDLVHHFAMEAVREESDGIIPLEGTDEQADMLDRIVERFEDAYGEYAEDRLVEVDEILGAKSAGDEAYPNLRSFIAEDLFAYHVDTMENTPIVWKLTTSRLLADATGEGFACFLDYHQLDASLFDRLSNQYLEPRKADLRERRSAANRRRNDDSLPASKQAEAAEQYERCASGLDQIAVFEEMLQELGSTDEREFDDEDRQRVEELAPKVAAFREETAERIDTLAELRERKSEDWFQDTFSPSFWEKVDEWRDEWLDALAELEGACEAYAKPDDEPVEAHLADLFDYFNWRLKGSDHYSSSGILFMTYYFEREGGDLLNDDGEPFETLTADEHLLASLATGVDDTSIIDEEYIKQMADENDVDDTDELPPVAEFKALAEEIDDRCQAVCRRIPSDWSDRALSEVTTAGYQPNHKHGVEINIRPLADAEIVPKTVDDQVL